LSRTSVSRLQVSCGSDTGSGWTPGTLFSVAHQRHLLWYPGFGMGGTLPCCREELHQGEGNYYTSQRGENAAEGGCARCRSISNGNPDTGT